ncbi:MAG: ligase-associated DNA damage response DEXH box helicase [Alphaproteobacteria bacterium]
MRHDASAGGKTVLPPRFQAWFQTRGWTPHDYQLAMFEEPERATLLIAPTGGGKTLAGFLPSLVALADTAEDSKPALHTLYISPLRALAVDVRRNLETPVAEMGLHIRVEARTGDTPASRRARQREKPPHILMTTPESLALLLSYEDSDRLFGSLSTIIVDEVHSLAGTKRGDLLSLGLARLQALAPHCRRVGLSATVARPAELASWFSPTGDADGVRVIEGGNRKPAEISILVPEARIPWAGHMALYAMPEVYQAIKKGGTTLVFVNTRAQAELVFQELWDLNEDGLAIALHHGSLAVEQRRKVEAAMAKGVLKAVVCTSSLDLGIDWGTVDLVIQVGAPKGATRLVQRIGRSNHRPDLPSRAILVPGNRFEFLECQAAIEAIAAKELDGTPPHPGGLDILAQHLLGRACAGPFDAGEFYREVTRAGPYRELPRQDFDEVLNFVESGGYALRAYDRFKRLRRLEDGRYAVSSPAELRRYRMNVGTIVDAPMVRVKLKRGATLGEIEEYFVQGLTEGDTFVFAGRMLQYEGMRETTAIVTPGKGEEPKVPAYMGGRLPLTTELATRVRGLLARPDAWRRLSPEVAEWLRIQRWRSVMPPRDGLLVETFPRGRKHFLVAYCFEGRNAHQTLGMLLTKRMERAGLKPLGFVATDYVLAVWSLRPARDMAALFDQDMLGDDLEDWLADSSMLKRTFRTVAVIAGLIERRHPGEEKTRRQVTFGSDLIYDVLRKHEPDHLLLRATRQDAARGLTDVRRLADMLTRVQGRIVHRALDRISPLAVPVLLEIGRESVHGAAVDELFVEAAEELIEEAMGEAALQGALL